MIKSIEELVVGDKIFPVFGSLHPIVASVHPYYILEINGNVLKTSYGGNCNPVDITFGDYILFKSYEDAKTYTIEARRFKWDQN